MEDNKKIFQAKSFVQTFLSSFAEKSLPELQEYLQQLEQQIASQSNELFHGTKSLTDLINTTFEAKHKACLHFVAARGDLQILKYVMEKYHPDLSIKDSENRNPFFTAIAHNHLEMVKYLVEECHQDANEVSLGGMSPLHIAVNHNDVEITRYLVERGANIEQKSDFATPLNWAVGSNSTDTALLLLQKGANPNGDLSTPFPPPLFIAIDCENQRLYNALIESGANLDVYDSNGFSVLHIASEKGNLNLVKHLIQKGANPNYECQGKSAFYLAVEYDKWDVVDYLRKYEKDHKSVEEKIQALKLAGPVTVTEEDRQKANSSKEEGNKLFAEKKYPEAVEKYSEAISFDPNNHILYSNRAAAYLSLQNFQLALVDAARAKEIDPTHTKSVYREAQAYAGLKNYVEAAASYWQASRLEPSNPELASNFKKYVQLAKNNN